LDKVIRITKTAFFSVLEGAKNVFPNEFVALIRGEEKEREVLLTEVIIPPLSEYAPTHSSFSQWLLPANLKELASFHSHPTPPALPSKTDLLFFSRTARYHFISCPPFSEKSTRVFNSLGKKLKFELV